MKHIFSVNTNPYNLRNNNLFASTNTHSVHNETENISHRGPQIWALVPEDIKRSKTLKEFQNKIKIWKPMGCTCRLCKTYISGLGFI